MAYKDWCEWKNKYLMTPQEIEVRAKQLIHLQTVMNDFPDKPILYAGLCKALCDEFHIGIEDMVRFCLYARKEGFTLTPEWLLTDGYDMIGR